MLPNASEIYRHVQKLSQEIGPRPGGTPANQAAAAYIEQVFRSSGLEVELNQFACQNWEGRETVLHLAGERLEAAANAFSPPCDVTAGWTAVCSVAELAAAGLRGRIAVLYGDLTSSPLSAKSWFLKSERDDLIIRLLEEKQPAAILTVNASFHSLPRLIEDWELKIPSATVPAQAALALFQQPGASLHLSIDSQISPARSANILAHKPGSGQGRLVLCAHYDTKVDTPGANDNAAGAAVLLALAQALSKKELSFGIDWVAFNNEEYLPMGDEAYVQRAGESFSELVAVLNFDGVGQSLGSNSITLIGGSPAFQAQLEGLSEKYPGVVWVDPWPESNHSTFTWRGVPGVAFSTRGAPLAHSRMDTIDWISPEKLAEVAALAAEIVLALDGKTSVWTRPGAGGEVTGD